MCGALLRPVTLELGGKSAAIILDEAATIWTESAERTTNMAKRVIAGTVGINGYVADFHSPTSMVKASGLGVKFGPESLLSYQRFQSVYL